MMPEISRYVKAFDDNKVMSFHCDDYKLIEKIIKKLICNKIEQLKGAWLAALLVHDDKYI